MNAQSFNTIVVLQGEFRISDRPQDMLTTLLGSCVATCLCDPVAGVGGINHFLLPTGAQGDRDSLRYGVNAMECLMNALYKQGARRERLEAKLFGGARMISGLKNIGDENIKFARWFLESEAIRCVGESVGGNRGRKIRYWPHTGQAQQQYIDSIEQPPPPEPVRRMPDPPANSGSVTLF